MKCPECGMEMEQGYFGCESNEFTKPSWFRKKSALGVGGEKLAGPRANICFFDASRCRDCKTVVFKY